MPKNLRKRIKLLGERRKNLFLSFPRAAWESILGALAPQITHTELVLTIRITWRSPPELSPMHVLSFVERRRVSSLALGKKLK
ncbi:MAG: hypothetical protein PSU93_02375 [Methylobacter sp.]|uniref:Uncharacterized protein n=1 Tax=Candidatus Methylobacter titanis TaxID=3053457 RepID=A0AA43Q3P8_9GAMM|nr:hypothetical protein [Candidatus Methylobacter titanis]